MTLTAENLKVIIVNETLQNGINSL